MEGELPVAKAKTSVKAASKTAKAAGKKYKVKYKKQNWLEFLCVVPALFFILLLNHYPLVEIVRYSFTNWNMLKPDYDYVGFKNWIWLIEKYKSNHVLEAFITTIKYTVGHMVIIIGGGMLLALLFNRKNKLFDVMRSVIYMPHYIGMSSICLVFMWLVNENFGVFNYMLGWFGVEPVKWLTNGKMALWTIIIMASWKGIGYDMIIYLSAMSGISTDYYEAAKIDGANGVDIFKKITMPLLAPTTLFLCVTQFIGSMKIFNAVDIMTGGGPNHATEVVVQLIYNLSFEEYRIDRATTISVVFFVFLVIVTAATMKWSNRKVNYDA